MNLPAQTTQRPVHAPTDARRIIWCVWFALLMAAPYAPYLYTAFPNPSYYPYACAATSLSKAFPWVALGMLLGFWIASHPTAEHKLNARPCLRRTVIGTSVALSAIAVITAWIYTALSLAHVTLPTPFLLLVEHIHIIATCGALGCGTYAWLAIGANDTPSRSSKLITRQNVAAFAMGALQPLAWVLVFPHARLPLPVYSVHLASWSVESTLATILLSLLPLAFMLVFALRATTPNSANPIKLAPAMALCAGILAFRVASRIAPSLHGTTMPLAIASLCAYLVFLYVAAQGPLPSLGFLPCKRQPQPTITTEADLFQTFSPQSIERLQGLGLTRIEIFVLIADALDLTSAQTATILDVSDSTVRNRRIDYRSKLDVQSAREAMELLEQPISPEHTSATTPRGNPLTRLIAAHPAIPWSTAVLCCLTTAGLLMLLPFPRSFHSQTDVWTTAFGIGCGLLAAWVALPYVRESYANNNAPGKSRISLTALALVASTCLLVLWRTGAIQLALDHAPHKAFVIACTTLFICSIAILIARVLGANDVSRLKAAVGASALASTPAILASGTGMVAWATVVLLAAIPGALIAVSVHVRPNETYDQTDNSISPLPLSWLAAVCFFAWLWSECWRATAYTSLIEPLQWGVLVLVILAIFKRGLVHHENAWFLTCIALAGITAAYALIPACLPVVSGLLLAIYSLAAVGTASNQYWHHPFLAIALGIIGGTLISNAAVFYLDRVNMYVLADLSLELTFFESIDGHEGVRFAYYSFIAIPLLATIWACSMVRPKDGQTNNRKRLLGHLVSLGLTPQQASIALLLANGHSVKQIAQELPCSESSVYNARKAAFTKLKVSSIQELKESLTSTFM